MGTGSENGTEMESKKGLEPETATRLETGVGTGSCCLSGYETFMFRFCSTGERRCPQIPPVTKTSAGIVSCKTNGTGVKSPVKLALMVIWNVCCKMNCIVSCIISCKVSCNIWCNMNYKM